MREGHEKFEIIDIGLSRICDLYAITIDRMCAFD